MTPAARPHQTLAAVLARHVHRQPSRRARRAAPPRTAPQRLTMADVLARHRLRRENQRLRTALLRARGQLQFLRCQLFHWAEPLEEIWFQINEAEWEIRDALEAA